MNDPFVLQQAEKFAERTIAESNNSEERIQFIYRNALSREPLADEVKKGMAFIESHAQRLSVAEDSSEVWEDFCHVMFNIKEFIYLN